MAEQHSSSGPPPGQHEDLHTTAAHEAHGGETPSLFKLDPGVGVWALVVFVCLLLILRKFAWGPIIASIDEREKNIRDSMDKAKQAQNESKRIANEQNEIFKEAKLQAASIIQEAKSTAETLANKIKKEAMEEKTRIVESGMKNVETAKAAAMSSLKKDTADLAINIAENLLNESMDDEKHRIYVDKVIDELSVKE
jgi:F-type H+-transporting ATPase subunit b